MILKDYYATLGIPVGSTPDAVKKAYRRLVMRYHPDKNAGEAAYFREIQEAYDVLSDPLRREDYHQQRNLWKAGGKAFEAPGPLTPDQVLREAIRLYEKVRAMDLYRMDREGIAHAIRRLLDDTVRVGGDARIAHFLLLSAAPLELRLVQPFREAFENLAAGDPSVLAEIAAFYKRKNKEAWVARYQTPLLILAALALCFLAYLLSR
ncbi:J domain-containing protein [Dinghuibacter silviterrae]|uniref:DnaJ-like protein n=1 Tax=Dinghuibacter silviterrae TaxID=1539049 RepID=A0A4R8DRC5_9BACT|nr:J domain-containing protein [Dinghuibacter silviterrae]TDX00744.1 DnaJ-like protein [Dinghuibacter silviterrae]